MRDNKNLITFETETYFEEFIKELNKINLFDSLNIKDNLKNISIQLNYFPYILKILKKNNIDIKGLKPNYVNLGDSNENSISLTGILNFQIPESLNLLKRVIQILKNNVLEFKWLNWEEIELYKERIIDWELEVMIKYHYPEKDIPRTYPEEKVNSLKSYLSTNQTFFMGIFKENKLIGYYWAFISDFLGEKVWNERSSYIKEEERGQSLGIISKLIALKKAGEHGCNKSKSMYAFFNKSQQIIFDKLGYSVSRIEIIKDLGIK